MVLGLRLSPGKMFWCSTQASLATGQCTFNHLAGHFHTIDLVECQQAMFAEALEVYGARTTHVRAPVGKRPSLAAIQAALDEKPYKMVTITHVDTSTGVLMPVEVRGP
eukprot:684712-Pelagomonas_calceolata.AAC.4